MSDPFVGQISAFGFNFAPRGWFLCQGQTLAISQYAALFSLIGTYYGGNGTTTFQLPNLQGNVPLGQGQGQGPGLSNYTIGETGGANTVTMLTTNMPPHTHALNAADVAATQASAAGQMLGAPFKNPVRGLIYSTTAPNTALTPRSISSFGGGQPHNNVQPTLVLNYCICYSGVFPTRS